MPEMNRVTYSSLGKFGRLGNQLFQIAATLAYSIDTNRIPVFPKWEYSELMQKELPEGSIERPVVYKEPGFHYHPIIRIKGDIDLSGYFQSYKYFQHQWENIKPYLSLKKILLNQTYERYLHQLEQENCSIHVRRGDYTTPANQQFHGLLNSDYYKSAIEGVYDCIPEETLFIIFSDDIEWCKNNFDLPNMFFVNGNDEITDLYLMSLCDNNIIANSSFSWWGAWMNKNPYKKVVAPRNWFGPNCKHNTKDLLPESWIKI